MLLDIEEDLNENQLDQINKALKAHKDLDGYRIVKWVSYHSNTVKSQNDDDEGRDDAIEVAENYMQAPRVAIAKRKNSAVKSQEMLEQDLSLCEKEKIESTVLGIEAHMNLWLNQERSKQNMYLRKKNLQVSDKESK